MDKTIQAILIGLGVLGFVGWLGGGRKWAFRTLLSTLVLLVIGALGVFLYGYGTDKAAEHRAEKLHECAVAKVADPKCEEPPKSSNLPKGSLECPLYILPVDATPEQEEGALTLAERECRGEMNPGEKSVHEQLVQYRREHGINDATTTHITPDKAKGDVFDQVERDCAGKIRKAYPGAYDDLDDEKLVKKVLAKDPYYCIAKP